MYGGREMVILLVATSGVAQRTYSLVLQTYLS